MCDKSQNIILWYTTLTLRPSADLVHEHFICDDMQYIINKPFMQYIAHNDHTTCASENLKNYVV